MRDLRKIIRQTSALIMILVFFPCLSRAASPVALTGEVSEVRGLDVKIRLDKPGGVEVGYRAHLNFVTSTGKDLLVGTWIVKSVQNQEVVATALDPEASARVGLKVTFTPADLKAAGVDAVRQIRSAANTADTKAYVIPGEFTNRQAASSNNGLNTVPVALPNSSSQNPPVFNGDPFSNENGQWTVELKWFLGIEFEPASEVPGIHQKFVKGGVYVKKVVGHSPAQKVNLKAGDVIFAVDQQPVATAREFLQAIQSSEGQVSLAVFRTPEDGFEIVVRLEKIEASPIAGDFPKRFDKVVPATAPNPVVNDPQKPREHMFEDFFPSSQMPYNNPVEPKAQVPVSPDPQKKSALDQALIGAVMHNDLDDVLAKINAGANVNVQNEFGQTPLHLARSVEVAKILLDNGADVNARDFDYGMTPLFNQSLEIVRLLVVDGADINARSKKNYTPLIWYAYSNNIEGSQFLISKGALVNAVNDEGSTALDIAERFNNQPMVVYLKSVGGKKNEK